jgi:tetratricopeptide (TPR) repeat protein
MKIFIGHSFDDKDDTVIGKFLEFFKSRDDIEVITGERVQNKSIAGKVQDKIGESDVFAGIFTCDKKIDTAKGIFSREKAYTTSNWVIQESGFALGRDKPLILIVEEGIYKFPELQGDLELIYFTRNDLEQPFVKLNQVIDSTLGKAKTLVTGGVYDRPESPEGKEEKQEGKRETPTPIGEEDAFGKYWKALDTKDPATVRKAYETDLVPALSSEDDKLVWKGFTLRMAHSFGDSAAFGELVELAEKNKDKAEVVEQLAIRLKHMGEYGKAKDKYLEVKDIYDITNESAKVSIVNCYVEASQCIALQGEYDEAISLLSKRLREGEFSGQRAQILKGLADIAEDNMDMERFFIYAEGCLDMDPTYTDLRFNLAYRYSAAGQHRISLLHYKKLTDAVEEPMGLNNLGAQYEKVDLKGKSINSYCKAADRRVTLAMANLANRYLDQGFVEDASKMIKRANDLSKADVEVHGNVGYAKNRLDSISKEENDKERELLMDAENERRFRVRYAESYLTDKTIRPNHFGGTWETQCGDLEIFFSPDENTIRAEKQTEVSAIKTRLVSIEGAIKNLSGTYSIKIVDTTKWSTGPTKDTFYTATGYMLLDRDDDTQIEVMEKSEKDKRSVLRWCKK